MKKLLLISAVLVSAFVMSSCSSRNHISDFDKSVDFGDFKTYKIVSHLDEEGDSPRSLTDRRIEKAINSELETRTYISTSEEADFLVFYSMDYGTSTSYYENSNGGRYGGRYSYSTVSEVETKYGIIKIDVVDAKTNNVVWSSSIKRNLPNKNQEEKLNKEISNVFRAFPGRIEEQSKPVKTD